jgi:hypothetical protein
MIKSRGSNGRASVTFTLAAAVGASRAAVCGEWNNWSADRDVMGPDESGFTHTVELEPGRRYRFRYLLDGYRWENDWAADAYVPNDHGGDDSVVDLTALAEEVPVPAAEASAVAPGKKAGAKKAAPAKKAAAKTASPTNKGEPNTARKPQPAKKAAASQRTTKKAAG